MPDSSLPAILYVVHRLPYPPDKGDRIRAFHLLRFLARRSRVYLACLADEPVSEESVAELSRYCERLVVVRLEQRSRWARALASAARGRTISEGAFHSPRLRNAIRGWAREVPFHASMASASSVAWYLRCQELRRVPAVVDLVDVDSQKWLDYAESSQAPISWLYRTEGRRLRHLEKELPTWVKASTLVSNAEVELYRQFATTAEVHAITNGVDLEFFQPVEPVEPENGCVFVGALDYPPNVDAACWFSREVWPHLHRRHSKARLRLVGRRPVDSIWQLAEVAGVEVVGQVPDVRPYLVQAAVVVAPLRIARGIQNKVLEGMAMGKPVVASPQVVSGLKNRLDVPVLIAESPAEWTELVGRLLESELLRRQLGAAGRRYVENQHDWERCLEPLGCLLGLKDSRSDGFVNGIHR